VSKDCPRCQSTWFDSDAGWLKCEGCSLEAYDGDYVLLVDWCDGKVEEIRWIANSMCCPQHTSIEGPHDGAGYPIEVANFHCFLPFDITEERLKKWLVLL
jgi:hypothetical protein